MLTRLTALAAFLSVALGAFGAHGLEAQLTAEALDWWTTATFYLAVHSVAAFAISLTAQPKLKPAAWVMLAGASLFAATLYAMALGAPRWFGAITPIGGVGLLVGWGMCVWIGARTTAPQTGDA